VGLLNSLDSEALPLVYPVTWLTSDVHGLLWFFKGEMPIQALVHPISGATCIVYSGGDASCEGFGSQTTCTPLGMPPLMQSGFWCAGNNRIVIDVSFMATAYCTPPGTNTT